MAQQVNLTIREELQLVCKELSIDGIPMAKKTKQKIEEIVDSSEFSELDLPELRELALDCRRCRLCEGRNNVVFGSGKTDNPLICFIGEGPGAEEDKRGEPFVGRAGQLLTDSIEKGLKLSRSDVYICNVVKCRPPENRTPLPDEMQACVPYLYRQLELINPKVIITLGQPAQLATTGIDLGITKLRGQWQTWRGFPLMPTLHPAYLLRNPPAKKDFWEDLKSVMEFLGI
jgi:uracil-DNA glycosylase